MIAATQPQTMHTLTRSPQMIPTDLQWGATYVARREAQAKILDREAVIAVEMGV